MGNGACGQPINFSQFISDAPSSAQFFSAPSWAPHALQLPSEPVTISGMGSSRCCSVDICFDTALHSLQWWISTLGCSSQLAAENHLLHHGVSRSCGEISVLAAGASPPPSFLGSVGLFLTLLHSLLNSILTFLNRFYPRCSTPVSSSGSDRS